MKRIEFSPRTKLIRTISKWFSMPLLFMAVCAPVTSFADLATGTEDNAKQYFRELSTKLGFSTPDKIFQTTLDDVGTYLGYSGITGSDLQNLDPKLLMNPDSLLAEQNGLEHQSNVVTSLGAVPFRPDDILATRFFAPKIMDIKAPEATRKLGWRKLVRLRARVGSPAQINHITGGIILFNFFTEPGVTPFSPTNESINTQVMLLTEASSVATPNNDGMDALYWLDYGPLSSGGKLSLALNASFDANELPQTNNDVRPYYVPDGCVACHGINKAGPLVNYLDTDHWFDRLDNDFTNLKASGISVVFDAHTNDTSSVAYKLAFDVIRRFNVEADEEVSRTQPKHDETLASHKWLEVHAINSAHVLPLDRAIGPSPTWSSQSAADAEMLDAFNRYCFRCHGTVKFSVFNRTEMRTIQLRGMLQQVLQPDAAVGIKMPPDRPLPDDTRTLMLKFIHQQ
jgi:hypothetical protein